MNPNWRAEDDDDDLEDDDPYGDEDDYGDEEDEERDLMHHPIVFHQRE